MDCVEYSKNTYMEEKKYKILQVHNYYQIPGGEDTVVANEKAMLERNGHTVIQYTRNNSELKEFGILRKILLPFTTVFNYRTFKEVSKLIESENIDIVHVHNTLNLISPAVYYAAIKKGIPVVQTIHNFRLLCPGATFYRDGYICEDCVKKGLVCAVKHKCYRGSFAQSLICAVNTKIHRLTGIYGKLSYICLTDFNKSKLIQLKQIKEENVYVKPNFVSGETGISVIPTSERKDQIVFAGRLDKLKGIDKLLQQWTNAMATNNEMKLVICGTGPLEQWCREFISTNSLSNVEMKGFIPNDEMKRIIAESKAIILPTQWYEGFPMTIVEAYSVGTPVIGSNMGNVSDLIVEGKTGIKVDFDDRDALDIVSDKLRSYTLDSDVIRGYYNNKYLEEQNYKSMMNIYTRVLGC